MESRFSMPRLNILSEIHSDAARDSFWLRANTNRPASSRAGQRVKKSGFCYELVSHDDCFKNSRMVIPSPDPLRGTFKRRLNSLQVRFVH
jgi:hypothetical protein